MRGENIVDIPLDKLKPNHLYELYSRNLTIGVYNPFTFTFTGIRTKFNQRFLDEETHWDKDPHHGTAKAIKDLGLCSIPLTDRTKLFDWLDEKGKGI